MGAATVSQMLSGNGYIKFEARERIQQAISVRLVLQLIQGEPAAEKRLVLPIPLQQGQSAGTL